MDPLRQRPLASSSTTLRIQSPRTVLDGCAQPLSPAIESTRPLYETLVVHNSAEARADRLPSGDPSTNSQQRSIGGQQFRVGNIGQNGALYLRPITRQIQPFPTPPMTPPPYEDRTLLSDNLQPTKDSWSKSLGSSSNQSPRFDHGHSSKRAKKERLRVPVDTSTSFLRGRANTFSTFVSESLPLEAHSDVRQSLGTSQRSRIASADLLKVSIPHSRLGTPYFSRNGSATIHSSLYTTSTNSLDKKLSLCPTTDQEIQVSDALKEGDFLTELSPGMRRKKEYELPRTKETLRGHVQVSPTTGKILGATPSGLIAQITSPSSVDYELLSDFFLTFRSYMKTSELVDYLVARLRWAFERGDDFGSVVRVRTFVALRHWILNYFVDDFACDYNLRKQFCNLVNQLCQDLSKNYEGGGGNLKVVGELKKCWKRTCALYWDISHLNSEDAMDNILPGGLLGSRDASVDGSSLQAQQRASIMARRVDAGSFGRFKWNENSRDVLVITPPPDEALFTTANHARAQGVAGPDLDYGSDESDGNAHDAWCSMPRRRQKQRTKQSGRSASTSEIQVAENAQRFLHLDRPSINSFRDSKINLTNTSNIGIGGSMGLPFPGSLIRGAIIHPTSPFVQTPAQEEFVELQLHLNQSAENEPGPCFDDSKESSRNDPGVRSFFRPMRKALSTRRNNGPAYYGDGRPRPGRPSSDSMDRRRPSRPAKGNGLLTSAGKPSHGRPALRIDLLAAIISESFKTVIKEEAVSQNRKDVALKKQLNEDTPINTIARVSTLDPLNSNPVMNNGGIIGITEAPEPPRQVDLRTIDAIERDQELGRDSLSNDLRLALNSDESETGALQNLSPTVKSSPTLPFRRLSAFMHDTTPGELELGDIHMPYDQSGQSTSYTYFSAPESGHHDHDQEMHRSGRELTSASLGADTTLTDATITSTNDPFSLERLPARQIRRQPGGDLRAVDHVHSLLGLGPTLSAASGSEGSRRESELVSNEYHAHPNDSTWLANSTRGSIQILPTPPLPPLGRNSFEMEVAKLAQLPDNEYDDGSRETALRKLEGLEEEKNVDHIFQSTAGVRDPELIGQSDLQSEPGQQFGDQHRIEEFVGTFATEPVRTETPIQLDPILTSQGVLYPTEVPIDPVVEGSRESIADSENSYCSTPLLHRGLSQPVMKRRNSSSDWLAVSLPDAASREPSHAGARESRHHVNQKYGFPSSPVTSGSKTKHHLHAESSFVSDTHQSFLLDENQSLRSHSTITQDELLQDEHASSGSGMRSFYNDDTDNLSTFRVSDILPHPLRHPNVPMNAHDIFPSNTAPTPPAVESKRYIPLQERVDFYANAAANAKASKPDGIQELSSPADEPNQPTSNSTAHYPFILCHDALTLAQQFTLIERDALSEIDWRELIDLRWRQVPNDTRNWVEYLKTGNTKAADEQPIRGGVDICITRFNIMVKWATSEIVLIEDPTERVACIVKYIQIAQYSRRLRNWATMFQITMALVSADVSRLKHTWSAVPDKDKATLKTIEAIIMPTRNFANLRSEMEAAANATITEADTAIGSTGGSIPFIGIYTHDLIYNAQKPAFIKRTESPADSGNPCDVDGGDPGKEDEEPLVNFERHCAAAAIVKGLLRTVEASARYDFEAKPEVLSFCLWMAALGDAEIERRSRELEGSEGRGERREGSFGKESG